MEVLTQRRPKLLTAPQAAIFWQPAQGWVRPYSTFALTITDKPQQVCAQFVGAMFMLRDGSAYRIERIDIGGYFGTTLLQRLVSRLQGPTRAIAVHVTQQGTDLPALAERLAALAVTPAFHADFEPQADEATTVAAIRRASGAAALFDAAGVPKAEDCLDYLI